MTTAVKTIRAVDLFCGAGGSSTGLLRAGRRIGRRIRLLAVNHWKEAIETHELNHPDVVHLHEDIAAIDPRTALADMGWTDLSIDLLWASPECTSHSYSRGGRPISEQSRATAWHPLRWCDQVNVKTVIIENVPSFRAWGPSDRNGRPIKARRGETYRAYLELLRRMGYTVEARVLNAADYGAAQTRRRLFIIGIKGARKIRWPEPTHAPAGSLLPGRAPWRGAKEIIDWSLKGNSIFNRKKPHARKTLERILIGGQKYWPALRPFLPVLRNHLLARSPDDPLPTVAANGTHIGLAEPVLVQVSHGGDHRGRVRPVAEPLGTLSGSRELGMAEALLVQVAHGDNKPGSGRGNGGRVRSVAGPLSTLTGSKELGVAQPFLIGTGGPTGQGEARPVDEPMQTILSRNHRGVVEPFVLVNRTHNTPKSVDDPLACLNGGNHLAVVEPFILPHRVFDKMVADSIEQPLRTLTTTGRDIGVVEPILLPHRTFDNMTADDVEHPLRTVTAKGCPALVEPVLAEGLPVLIPFNGERNGQTPRTHSVEDPLPTVTTGGAGQKGLASPVLMKYSRTGGARSAEQPLDTLTAKPRYGLVTPEMAEAADALPVGSVTPWGIKIGPTLYLDILFRMLRVHELGQGQGFPPDYRFTGTVEEQVKQVGNAVEVHQAEALCFAVLT